MIFQNTDKEITIIYNSDEHVGKQILAYAQTEGLPIRDIDLKHTKITPSQWIEISGRMGLKVKDLINVEDPDFIKKFNGVTDLSDQDWLTLLTRNPEILSAPIVMKGDKVVMMSNSQDMLHFV